uniref:Glutamyl-tRNA amidotransferase subunit A n=1 Tax=Rhizophora mucronata TaxID=61149 RepID=A0A2P2MGD3_RHIMU
MFSEELKRQNALGTRGPTTTVNASVRFMLLTPGLLKDSWFS